MSENSAPKIKVLVVCLGMEFLVHGDRRNVTKLTGNICRSPMGEAVLRHTANKRGISILVDSCGTAGYHVGEEPDERWVIHMKCSPPRIDFRLATGQSKPVKRYTRRSCMPSQLNSFFSARSPDR